MGQHWPGRGHRRLLKAAGEPEALPSIGVRRRRANDPPRDQPTSDELMQVKVDLSGQRFGSLVAIRKCPERRRHWICRCDCGNEHPARIDHLQRGATSRCADCCRSNKAAKFRKHGLSHTPEYKAWCHMVERCTNPTNQRWAVYGKRGISVCPRWMESFEAFYADMGPRPSHLLSLDRIDNDGHYEPENCRWATKEEQNGNQTTTVFVEYKGQRLCLAAAARAAGLRPGTVRSRQRLGWPEHMLLGPPGTRFISLNERNRRAGEAQRKNRAARVATGEQLALPIL